ncbi:hypothetical protein SAMN05661080_02495 [Modestobacter sp. DSM 44400]|uniref:hypothetical protein n=1 Tax=Modestobacter sp. DSM 44400 TaxID=1550230 RepID=UPI00089B9AD7|nr:hypothetical protein [Modestobacter sp. DSM 44400]SDY15571.1 hypothetical protein SAMN05661080_02495 [Modestobacter sp. DSM 44400]
MTTAVLAWLAVAAACTGAVLFGHTARTAPVRGPRPTATRVGLAVSLSGPWLAVLLSAAGGALTGQWLVAAVAALVGVLVAAVVGLALDPS